MSEIHKIYITRIKRNINIIYKIEIYITRIKRKVAMYFNSSNKFYVLSVQYCDITI